MKVTVSLNEKKQGVELLFRELLAKALSNRLKELGFKQGYNQSLKWYAPKHPAYISYARNLKEALLKEEPLENVPIHPSYHPTEENIDHNKFSYVTLSFGTKEALKQSSYVVFDPYKAIAAAVARQFGKNQYDTSFKQVDVSARKYKRKARVLLKAGKVIPAVQVENPATKANKLKTTPDKTPSSPIRELPAKTDPKNGHSNGHLAQEELSSFYSWMSKKANSSIVDLDRSSFITWMLRNHPKVGAKKIESYWKQIKEDLMEFDKLLNSYMAPRKWKVPVKEIVLSVEKTETALGYDLNLGHQFTGWRDANSYMWKLAKTLYREVAFRLTWENGTVSQGIAPVKNTFSKDSPNLSDLIFHQKAWTVFIVDLQQKVGHFF